VHAVGDAARRPTAERRDDPAVDVPGGGQTRPVAGVGAALGGDEEPRAELGALGAEREGGHEPGSVHDAAGRDHRHVHRPDDLRNQGERAHHDRTLRVRHLEVGPVTTGLAALCDDDVRAGFGRGHRVRHRRDHRDHRDPRLARHGNDGCRVTQPGRDRGDALLERDADQIERGCRRRRRFGGGWKAERGAPRRQGGVDLVLGGGGGRGHREQDVGGDRRVGQGTGTAQGGPGGIGGHPRQAERAEAPGLADGGDELRGGRTPGHARQQDRMTDAEEVAERCVDAHRTRLPVRHPLSPVIL